MNEQAITIELKLPLPAVNVIMGALAKQPFDQVADLILAIREQATPQLPVPDMKAQPATAE